ncbi:NADH-quinone oxidoreductase subunit M [uncultured Friedmanniella sp.]|uniref:NADH-quinone oxidoreductase subunit M n=1 Tax=uncultured Friedmanniella sp. TaxID=335381 RepID=UPI0035CC9603
MTSGPPWLTILALLPAVGAVVCLLAGARAAKLVALVVSLLTLGVALSVAAGYSPGSGMQLTEQVRWIKPLGAYYALGIDGIGLTLVLLVVLVTPVVVLASWRDFDPAETGAARVVPAGAKLAPKYDAGVFYALVLAVETCALFLFLATDVFLFYVFFEVILIPMYLLIGGFGPTAKRSSAAAKFLIFGLLGGFVMLASVIGLYGLSAAAGTPSYLLSDLSQLPIGTVTGRWLFIGFMFAFAVKAPLVPLHSWLPDAAEESSPGGATMMVGVMDKIGTFGMIRFCLGLFPEASQWATPVVLILATLSIIYGAVLAIGSRDLMRFIAYTSISHFGFIVLGIFALTTQSLAGSTLYMLNHGLSTAALFIAAGYLVKRGGSRDISAYGGVQKVAPVLAGLMLFAGLSTLSLPGLSSFVSEFMVLAGTFSRYPAYAIVSTLAIVLAALYILITYQRTMTGPLNPRLDVAGEGRVRDLNGRERLAMAPLVLLILALGVFPKPMLDLINPAVQATMSYVGVSDPAPRVAAEGGR